MYFRSPPLAFVWNVDGAFAVQKTAICAYISTGNQMSLMHATIQKTVQHKTKNKARELKK